MVQKFYFRSAQFELTLEGFEDPLSMLRDVSEIVEAGSLPTGHEVSQPPAETEAKGGQDEVSINGYLASKKPKSCRKALEATAEYMTKVQGKHTFSRETLIETATKSNYFRADWKNQISINLSRMIEAGYLIHLASGEFRLKD